MAAQVWTQTIGVLATLVYTAIVSFVILKIVDAMVGLRVSEEQEAEGLDLTQHGERGYILGSFGGVHAENESDGRRHGTVAGSERSYV